MTTHTPDERRLARQTRSHLIVSVQFQRMAEEGRPMSEAPLECSCGEWTTSGGWAEHRGLTQDQLRVLRSHRAWNERQAVA
jgi:hypothetical protein